MRFFRGRFIEKENKEEKKTATLLVIRRRKRVESGRQVRQR